MVNYSYEVARDTIELDYGFLQEDETRSGVLCPACQGGGTKEGSLSVSRSGGALLWKCHRASCSFSGSSGSSFISGPARPSNKRYGRPAGVEVTPLNRADAKFLAARYGLTADACELGGLGWTGEGTGTYSRRVCLPIYGPDLKQRGENYRSYQGASPKSIIKLAYEDAIPACWYKWKRKSPLLVITEDQVSAMRVAPHYHSLALLGTHIDDSKANELVDSGKYDRIYLCLDNDATMAAVKLQLKWRDKLPHMVVLGLPLDIKDMDNKEFDLFLNRLT